MFAAQLPSELVRPWRGRVRYQLGVVLHLAGRVVRQRNRRAALGWVWTVAQPLMRFGVVLFVFTRIIPTGVPNYPQYLFVGLAFWMWFAAGVTTATLSPQVHRDVFFRPNAPRWSVPVSAVLVEAVDLLASLPIVFVLVFAAQGTVPATAVLLPLGLAVQFLLISGIGMVTSAANVRYHDVRLLVEIVVWLGFYVTPVFYVIDVVPDGLRPLVRANPMTPVLEAQRAVLVDGTMPDWATFGVATLVAATVFAVGAAVYQHASQTFVDEL
jgi:ABC-type polysaccharide/polyol phosphate export permease